MFTRSGKKNFVLALFPKLRKINYFYEKIKLILNKKYQEKINPPSLLLNIIFSAEVVYVYAKRQKKQTLFWRYFLSCGKLMIFMKK